MSMPSSAAAFLKLSEKAKRKAVLAAARDVSRTGLSPGRSGNVSCRHDDGMLITPSGLAYDEIDAADIVRVAADGSVSGRQNTPSSEWRFHLAAYAARPDMNALVHTHSLNATALACAHKPIPAFHYMVAVAGGTDIPLVPYATYGTEALSHHVAKGLACRDAILLANHGAIAIGETMEAALELAHGVEALAAQYVKVLSLGGAHILPDEEMQVVVEKFKSYGRRAPRRNE